jgi:hypothetical protein
MQIESEQVKKIPHFFAKFESIIESAKFEITLKLNLIHV